jgi:hypothetical protein
MLQPIEGPVLAEMDGAQAEHNRRRSFEIEYAQAVVVRCQEERAHRHRTARWFARRMARGH